MEKKHQVHNLIILDESGSMETIKKTIIQGFNELVQTIQGIEKQYPEQAHFISFYSFNGLGIKQHHHNVPAGKLKPINESSYMPDANTPLHDAMGFAIHQMKQLLEGKTDYNVLVTILTDGAENASKEYSGSQIKQMVDELKQSNWTFTYMGTDHDVTRAAASLSIQNVLHFEKNADDVQFMFQKERRARQLYSDKIRSNEDTRDGYFDPS
jgi:uncharacterized protein YegL